MTQFSPEQAVHLASALIHLRGETLTSISKATGIRAPNLSVWLRGKPQVIAEHRVVKLLHYLGVQGDMLRADMLHEWQVQGRLEDVHTALQLLVTPDERKASVVYRNDDHGFRQMVLLLIAGLEQERIAIRLAVEPGVARSVDVSALAFGFSKDILGSKPVSELPTDPKHIASCIDALNGAEAGQAQSDSIGDLDWLLMPGFIDDVTESEASKKPVSDVEQLRHELSRILGEGVPCKRVAEVLANAFPPHDGKRAP
jgi:hypothetical protein